MCGSLWCMVVVVCERVVRLFSDCFQVVQQAKLLFVICEFNATVSMI